MKKVLAILLATALVLSALPFVVFAEKAELPSMGEYEGSCYTNLDNVFKDGELMTEDGKGLPFLNENDFVVQTEAQTLGIGGWVAFDTEIKGFGYRIDGGEAVFSEDFIHDAEAAVQAAAATVSCDYSARFFILANVEGLKGDHLIEFLVKAGNETYTMYVTGLELSITYKGPADENATPAPEEGETEVQAGLPGIFFAFDEEDKYEGLFSGGREVEDIGWDSENKCELIQVVTSQDPSITVNATLVASDFFDEDIDLSKYKVLSIGVKLDENHGTGGQIYYDTDEDPGFGEGKVTMINYKNHTDFQAITINYSKVKKWSGILNTFRYDVFGTLNAEESTVQVYYIAFFETKADADNFAKLFAEKQYEAFPVVATPTPKPTNTPSPTPTATPDAQDVPEVQETEAPTETAENGQTEEKKESGCGSIIGGGLALTALTALAGTVLAVKRKKD